MITKAENISTTQSIKNFFLDLIFPPTCLGCRKITDAAEFEGRLDRPVICGNCLSKIGFKTDFTCAFCQAAVINGKTCPFCRKDHELDQLLVVTNYEQPLVQTAIKSFKYRFMASLGHELGSLLVEFLKSQAQKEVIGNLSDYTVIPVPLSPQRLRWRGYNQAEILTNFISEDLNMEKAEALQRIKHTKPQVDMKHKEERLNNLKNVFQTTGYSVTDKKILLIDDVATTGSTLEECAKALKSAGAKSVVGLVIARN